MEVRQRIFKCCFCGLTNHEIAPNVMVSSDKADPCSATNICQDCVYKSVEVIMSAKARNRDDRNSSQRGKPATQEPTSIHLAEMSTPKQVYDLLSNDIMGQEEAKRTLATAIAEHLRRRRLDTKEKSNIVLLGPTGSGKTALAVAAAKILNMPLAIVDATTYTPRGYVGTDLDDIIVKLLERTRFNIREAEHGVVFIDEFDKLFSLNKTSSEGGNLQLSLQYELLKMIEGQKMTVKVGPKADPKEYTVDTSKILFICAGAFVGLEGIVRKKDAFSKSMGISADVGSTPALKSNAKSWQSDVCHDHLVKFGMIPELAGRLPVVTYTKALTKKEMTEILTHPNSKLSYYQMILSLDGVNIKFKKDFIEAVVEEAMNFPTGARSLKTVLDRRMKDIMFDAFSRRGKTIEIGSKKVKIYDSEPSLPDVASAA